MLWSLTQRCFPWSPTKVALVVALDGTIRQKLVKEGLMVALQPAGVSRDALMSVVLMEVPSIEELEEESISEGQMRQGGGWR